MNGIPYRGVLSNGRYSSSKSASIKPHNENDSVLVHQLQRLLIKSWSAKCLAVRRVTQDNQGKKTAGIDGMKALSPQQRMRLVQSLRVNLKTRPVRRVWIPKPNAPTEKRGLGIPTLVQSSSANAPQTGLRTRMGGKVRAE